MNAPKTPPDSARRFRAGPFALPLGHRTLIMGVVNVTPDSFSDGGLWLDADAAVAQARALVEAGADLIDLGAESTRPGHRPIDREEEWARLGPVLQRLAADPLPVPVSVDTRKPWVAERALAAGASILNDINGFVDPAMAAVLAATQAGAVVMFNRTPPFADGMVEEDAIADFLRRQVAALEAAGVCRDRLLVDPGLGFGYGVEDNWRVLRRLDRFRGIGAGLLLGPSRKRFLGAVTGLPPAERDIATAAVCALAATAGVDVVRVHAVTPVRQALAVADRWGRSS